MRGVEEWNSEDERRSSFPHPVKKRALIGLDLIPNRGGKRYGIAFEIENQACQTIRFCRTEAECRRNQEGSERMGGVEVSVNYFVANCGPADFAAEVNFHAVLFEEAKFLGHHQWRAIAERHEADSQGAGAGRGTRYHYFPTGGKTLLCLCQWPAGCC